MEIPEVQAGLTQKCEPEHAFSEMSYIRSLFGMR